MCICCKSSIKDAEGRLQRKAEAPVVAAGPDTPVVVHAGVKFGSDQVVIEGLPEVQRLRGGGGGPEGAVGLMCSEGMTPRFRAPKPRVRGPGDLRCVDDRQG